MIQIIEGGEVITADKGLVIKTCSITGMKQCIRCKELVSAGDGVDHRTCDKER